MPGRSCVALVLLAAAVSCAVAQHAPPVSELEPRRREGRAVDRGLQKINLSSFRTNVQRCSSMVHHKS
ncbi:N-acylsphingosine amidohydrolase 1 [Homo sapiens]|uniref:N-acylsphingosine amidohydrolase 1 n=2 Tax=Homo sapiens TaxID=9606 RepID=A0A1B0GVA8_HUMAN|nr:N-acylsphingosine amidohydrolase 1 [Homo sapiens]KAI4009699.1 N-acylsphingosine amidohydrolase 1 [Homo sapiens]